MSLINEILETFIKTDEKNWKIIETAFGLKLTINNWDFDISDIDEVSFYRDGLNVSNEILSNRFWKWNGFYKYIKHINYNREILEKLLEDLKINSKQL